MNCPYCTVEIEDRALVLKLKNCAPDSFAMICPACQKLIAVRVVALKLRNKTPAGVVGEGPASCVGP